MDGKVFIDTWYATIHEDFRKVNGEHSDYHHFHGVLEPYFYGEFKTKEELKEVIEEYMVSQSVDIKKFFCVETEFGWEYEAFVEDLGDGFTEFVREGEHTDVERYTIDVSLYRRDYDAFERLG